MAFLPRERERESNKSLFHLSNGRDEISLGRRSCFLDGFFFIKPVLSSHSCVINFVPDRMCQEIIKLPRRRRFVSSAFRLSLRRASCIVVLSLLDRLSSLSLLQVRDHHGDEINPFRGQERRNFLVPHPPSVINAVFVFRYFSSLHVHEKKKKASISPLQRSGFTVSTRSLHIYYGPLGVLNIGTVIFPSLGGPRCEGCLAKFSR